MGLARLPAWIESDVLLCPWRWGGVALVLGESQDVVAAGGCQGVQGSGQCMASSSLGARPIPHHLRPPRDLDSLWRPHGHLRGGALGTILASEVAVPLFEVLATAGAVADRHGCTSSSTSRSLGLFAVCAHSGLALSWFHPRRLRADRGACPREEQEVESRSRSYRSRSRIMDQ